MHRGALEYLDVVGHGGRPVRGVGARVPNLGVSMSGTPRSSPARFWMACRGSAFYTYPRIIWNDRRPGQDLVHAGRCVGMPLA